MAQTKLSRDAQRTIHEARLQSRELTFLCLPIAGEVNKIYNGHNEPRKKICVNR